MSADARVSVPDVFGEQKDTFATKPLVPHRGRVHAPNEVWCMDQQPGPFNLVG